MWGGYHEAGGVHNLKCRVWGWACVGGQDLRIWQCMQESRDHESRAGSESGPRYWAQPLEEAAAPSGAGQPPLGSLADHPLPPPSAPSLQALMKTNPGILKTIQMNEPQPGRLLPPALWQSLPAETVSVHSQSSAS